MMAKKFKDPIKVVGRELTQDYVVSTQSSNQTIYDIEKKYRDEIESIKTQKHLNIERIDYLHQELIDGIQRDCQSIIDHQKMELQRLQECFTDEIKSQKNRIIDTIFDMVEWEMQQNKHLFAWFLRRVIVKYKNRILMNLYDIIHI